MKKLLSLFMIPLLLFIVGSCSDEDCPDPLAPAETVFSAVFQQGIWPSSDYSEVANLYIDESIPGGNNFGSNTMFVRSASDPGGALRILIKFGIQGQLPASVVIEKAILTMTSASCNGNGTEIINAHEVTESWLEPTGTWDHSGYSAWDGGNFSATAMSSFIPCQVGHRIYSLELDPEMVQRWLLSNITNKGVLLKYDVEQGSNSSAGFHTSQDPDLLMRPFLTVYYSVGL